MGLVILLYNYRIQFNSFILKQLCGYEIPRAVFLEPKPFSVESGVITPTFKLRRKAAAEKYASALKEMYQSVIE